ncbi:MAG: carbon-nitrogen hydrolase family protein [Eubacteriaceae bacterium]
MKEENKIIVATCQFPVSKNILNNSSYIQKQLNEAASQNAEIVHFPECALSGYIGRDFKNIHEVNWDLIKQEKENICNLVKKRKIYLILGSSFLDRNKDTKAYNCLYLIGKNGKVREIYSKRFSIEYDLDYYSLGDNFVTFEINGVRCGLLICYEIRFPELYREYKRKDVKVIFHSFYNANKGKKDILSDIIPATIKARAASNYLWISASNASRYYQSWGSMLVRPDGSVYNCINRHKSGIMVNEINLECQYYDSARTFRSKVMDRYLIDC